MSWGALLGGAIGTGVGVLLGLVFLDNDPLGLGGIGLFLGFCVGAGVASKVFWSLERYRAQIVEEASLVAQKQSVDASKPPDWWPTEEEFLESLNEQPKTDEAWEVTLIVPSPRPRRRKPDHGGSDGDLEG